MQSKNRSEPRRKETTSNCTFSFQSHDLRIHGGASAPLPWLLSSYSPLYLQKTPDLTQERCHNDAKEFSPEQSYVSSTAESQSFRIFQVFHTVQRLTTRGAKRETSQRDTVSVFTFLLCPVRTNFPWRKNKGRKQSPVTEGAGGRMFGSDVRYVPLNTRQEKNYTMGGSCDS